MTSRGRPVIQVRNPSRPPRKSLFLRGMQNPSFVPCDTSVTVPGKSRYFHGEFNFREYSSGRFRTPLQPNFSTSWTIRVVKICTIRCSKIPKSTTLALVAWNNGVYRFFRKTFRVWIFSSANFKIIFSRPGIGL